MRTRLKTGDAWRADQVVSSNVLSLGKDPTEWNEQSVESIPHQGKTKAGPNRNLSLRHASNLLCVITVVSRPRSPKRLTAMCAAFGFALSRVGHPRKLRAQ